MLIEAIQIITLITITNTQTQFLLNQTIFPELLQVRLGWSSKVNSGNCSGRTFYRLDASSWILCPCLALLSHKGPKSTNRENTKTCHSHNLQLRSWYAVYTSMLFIFTANINTLACRRNDLSIKFFRDITQPSSCLHCLLPAPRYQSIISCLRTSEIFPKVYTRIKCYCSFINYALNHYQDKISN